MENQSAREFGSGVESQKEASSMNKTFRRSMVFMVCLALAASSVRAEGGPKGGKDLRKTATVHSYAYITINNIFSPYANDLSGSVEMNSLQNSGFEWPKGSGKTAIYEDGFIYAGYYMGRNSLGVPANRKFANGSAYISGMTEGSITRNGTGVEPVDAQYQDLSDPAARVYRVRTDMNPYGFSANEAAMVAALASEELPLISRFKAGVTGQSLYDQYKKDWDEWPASKGAPFEDKDGDGVYNPHIDIPGIADGDQTLWMVCNDMNFMKSQALAGSIANGIEIQRTVWAYKSTSDFGNVLFMRYRLFNKSGARIDSMFLGLFSDVELGFAGDDFVGCDTARSLGFCYNGKPSDQLYGDVVPSVGYVLLQGPIVQGLPSDSAAFDFHYVQQKKNLTLSSFDMFIGGGGTYGDPPQGNSISGRDQWWNLLNGRIGVTGGAWISPSGDTTKFPLAGDPVTGVGWTDGSFAPPGDRRLVMTCGPLTIEPGDTQEVVYATVIAQSADRISSITALRASTDELRGAYVQPFGLPRPPPSPNVVVTPFDNAILLSWGDPAGVKAIEQDYESKGYKFQGYVVYQSEDIYFTNPKLIAMFDTPYGSSHYLKITSDAIKSGPLVNGRSYFFAVRSIAYKLTGGPQLFAQSAVVEAIPQSPKPGTQLANTMLDLISGKRLTGTGDATVIAQVIDPTKTITADYVVTFDTLPGPVVVWSLSRGTTTLISNATYQGDPDKTKPIYDGLLVNTKRWSFNPPAVISSFVNHGANINLAFQGNYLNATSFWWSNCGRADLAARLCTSAITQWDLEFRFTGVTAQPGNPDTTTVSGGQWTTYYCRGAYGDLNPLTKNHKNILSPFELWDIENNIQIQYAVVDRNRVGGAPGPAWWGDTGNWGAASPYFRMAGRECIIPIYKPYDAATAQATTYDPTDSLATWMLWFAAQDDYYPSGWATGDYARALIQNPIAPKDTYGFSVTAATVGDRGLARTQSSQINVFPNPYFGPQPLKTSAFTKVVTFTHLPQRAIIRIYTLAGYLVKSFDKDSPSQFLTWDMMNSEGIIVASGVYIVHIEMPELGISRILKLAIILPVYAPAHL